MNFIGENPDSSLYLLSDVYYARVKAVFGGNDNFRDPAEIDADEFIGVKSYKARGKRISTFEIENVEELEPLRFPEVVEEVEVLESKKIEINLDEDLEIDGEDNDESKSQEDIRDEITGQMKLF